MCSCNKRMEAVLVVLHRTLLGDLADALPITGGSGAL